VCCPSYDSTFSLAVNVATVVLAASGLGLLLQKLNFVLDSAFQSPSQPRGLRKLPCNNTAAVGLSVYDELIFGGKVGHGKKMKRQAKQQNLSRFSGIVPRTSKTLV
jgi:hypothetical protein